MVRNLSYVETRRDASIKVANGSDEHDYESSGEEEIDGGNREDHDDQPTRQAGRSRCGRTVTRFLIKQAKKKSRNFAQVARFLDGCIPIHFLQRRLCRVKR